jgi:chemotaxis protein methyltransferase CheR
MAFTYFFRDSQTLMLAVSHLMDISEGMKNIRIWDAGCATGQEAYTLAIMLAESMNTFAFRKVHIDATDIDETGQFEPIIIQGIYPNEQVLRLPEDIKQRFFKEGRTQGFFQIDNRVKNRITFINHDLLSLKSIGKGYCLIVCKNVLLHFHPEERESVIRMFYESLIPNGFLVMEHTQQLPISLNPLFKKTIEYGQLYQKFS